MYFLADMHLKFSLFWAHIVWDHFRNTWKHKIRVFFSGEKSLDVRKKSPFALRLISLLSRKNNWGIKETILQMGTVKKVNLQPPFLFVFLLHKQTHT